MAIVLVVIFALFDSFSTIYFLEMGWATEINPVMEWYITVHPALFLSVKLVLTALVAAWLYKWRWINKARWIANGTAIFYGLIAALHCVTHIYYGH